MCAAIVRRELLKASVKLKNEFIADKNKISVSIFMECVDVRHFSCCRFCVLASANFALLILCFLLVCTRPQHITMDLDALIKKERIPKEMKKRSTMKLDLSGVPSRYKVAPEAE